MNLKARYGYFILMILFFAMFLQVYTVQAAVTYKLETSVEELEKGEVFTLYIKCSGDMNTMTGFVEYDSDTLKATEVKEVAGPLVLEKIQKQLEYVPDKDDEDYANADGVKSCADLGKIKIAGFIKEYDESNNKLNNWTGNDTVCAIEFEALKSGSPEIKYTDLATGEFSTVGTKIVLTTQNPSETEVVIIIKGDDGTYYFLAGDALLTGDYAVTDAGAIVNHTNGKYAPDVLLPIMLISSGNLGYSSVDELLADADAAKFRVAVTDAGAVVNASNGKSDFKGLSDYVDVELANGSIQRYYYLELDYNLFEDEEVLAFIKKSGNAEELYKAYLKASGLGEALDITK